MDKLYPIFIKLSGTPVLIIGGGEVATRKARRLVESGAALTVITTEATDELQEMAKKRLLCLKVQEATSEDVAGFALVFCATNNADLNRALALAAAAEGALTNVADAPEISGFYVPALVERDRLQIAISTSGASPALAKQIRLELEERFDFRYDLLLAVEAYLRERILEQVSPEQRVRLFSTLAQRLPSICREAEDPRKLREGIEGLLGRQVFIDFAQLEQLITPYFR